MTEIKRLFCWLFGHKFETENEYQLMRTGHCKRCKKKMWGAYMKGEYTGKMFWVYILGEFNETFKP